MKCQRLNNNGKRCRREAVYIEHYYGDREIYDDTLGWVEICVCGHHKTVDEDSENFVGRIKTKQKEIEKEE